MKSLLFQLTDRLGKYLAANPVDIPGFQELVRGCTDVSTEEENSQSLSKSSWQQSVGIDSSKLDLFSTLPNEILTEIIWYLSSRDIANLRLATRSYRYLPDILFKHLIRTEMPFFWEIDELQSGQTDWSQLYAKLKIDWRKNVLGLRNRERIWKEVEGIVDMIRDTNYGLVH